MIVPDAPFALKVVIPAFFCVLSLLGSVILVICYKKVLRLRHNSGKIILYIVICEIFLTLLYCISFFYTDAESNNKYPDTFAISPPLCKVLGFFQIYFSTCYCLLNTALIHNFYKSLTQKQKSFLNRQKLYTWGTLSISMVLSVVAIADNGITFTPYGFCGINNSSFAALFAFFPMCVSFPFGIYAIIHSILKLRSDQREHTKNQLISDPYEYQVKLSFVKSHRGFITIYILCWFPFQLGLLVHYFNPGPYKYVGLSVLTLNLLCITSFLMMAARLIDPILRKVIWKYFRLSVLRKGSGFTTQISEPGVPTLNEPILLQKAYSPDENSPNTLTRTFADPQLAKFRAIAPKVGCNKHYESMVAHDFKLILLALENMIQIQNFDSESLENLQQTPWANFYYTEICVRELNLTMKPIIQDRQSEDVEEEEINVNAIIHAPKVLDHLLSAFSISRDDLVNCLRLDRNINIIRSGFNNTKSEIYKPYQFLSYNKAVLVQRMEKEQKFGLLESFLSAYHNHVIRFPNTRIQRMLGIYSLGTLHKKYNILLIQNVYHSYYQNIEDEAPELLTQRIVLDGHYVKKENLDNHGMVTRSRKYTVSIKLPEIEKTLLNLRAKDRVRLLQLLSNDFDFLEKAGILEYKLHFLLARNTNKSDAPAAMHCSAIKDTHEDADFLRNLTTSDGEYKVEVFISLGSFIHAKKVGCQPGSDACLFSRANPQIYRQCIEEFLMQHL